MDEFVIYHVSWEENLKANALAQQASGYNVQKINFQEQKLMFSEAEGYVLEERFNRPIQPVKPGTPSDRLLGPVRPPLGGQPYFGHYFFQNC
jgi:hypothetical protein